ncbi:hypothetical protein A2574_01175 [Candidatus Shapirobacteria bacterium RIFOXYD1_FULL_38_32]|uniref:Nucleotidyltransferase/DNA polymerase involved in DNA repair n=2 Tax=Candidatus Shapironibacteriota TaxID=1752721 RepID=A0A0G0JSF9_9BACT
MDTLINPEPVEGLPFNRKPSTIMHIDLNSCFATIEQQANPLLRGRPVAVAAYTTPSGCIVAPSIEAKKLGIKVGFRVKDAKLICPDIIILPPDPWKYRNVHLQLRELISRYTNDFVPKSIDEFVLNFEGYPSYRLGLTNVAAEIKQKIKQQIGEWLTVSVGIGPNRFLAKQASNLQKPDGLEEINYKNFKKVYQKLTLMDLHGIKKANTSRLNSVGVHTVLDFYHAPLSTIKSAFHSINAYYWHLRLRGWEIDDVEFKRHSFGAMYSIPKPLFTPEELSPILHKLVEKTVSRMRNSGYSARGIHVALLYKNRAFWHHGKTISEFLFTQPDIYKVAYKIMTSSPYSYPVANLAVSVFDLQKLNSTQLDLFNTVLKKVNLAEAIDHLKEKWGDYIITPAMMLGTGDAVPDRIGFGNIKDLENFIFSDDKISL